MKVHYRMYSFSSITWYHHSLDISNINCDI